MCGLLVFVVVVVLFVFFWGGEFVFVGCLFCCFLEEGYKLWSVVVFCGCFLFVVVFVCCFVFLFFVYLFSLFCCIL